MNRTAILGIACACTVAMIVGCSSEPEPKPLGADQFYRPVDKGGPLTPGPVPRQIKPEVVSPSEQQQTESYKFVADQVRSPQPIPEMGAVTTQPTETPAPAKFVPGQYLSVGGVIAEVNGNPIYADDVMRTIAPALAGRAKDLDETRFRSAAMSEIGRQVDDMVRAEVEYAAAVRNTTDEEKKLAERATEVWRDRVITESKGSIEEARRHYREQGRTFDEVAKEQGRLNLVRVYYTKKLFPRIQVTAEDMRRYYERNKEAQFTDRDSAVFTLIKVGIKETGSADAAKTKIEDLAARAARGEDFKTLADFNQDALLLRTRGEVGPIDRGAYKVDAVDQAVWSLKPGEISPVIKTDDAYYILRLDSRKLGRVMAFEEDAVQKKMQESLRGEQFTKMRKEMEAQLRKESVVSKNQQMMQTTLDMAMQNYARWRE